MSGGRASVADIEMIQGHLAPAERTVTMPAGVPKLTLGWEAISWAVKYLKQPNGPNAGQRWAFIESQARWLLWWYALDEDGRWLFDHGARRLAKGSGKSPFAGVSCHIEFNAPVRLDDFDPKLPGGCKGKPVGLPWIQVAATSESQTANTMRMVRALCAKGSRLATDYALDVGKAQIYRPDGGQLEVITSSSAAAEGAEITYAVADETEHWTPARGGPDLAEVMDRNLAKSGSRMMETCNAWEPGIGTVAETTFDAWVAQEERRTRGKGRILYDARVAPQDIDLADEEQLRAALRHVYDDCWWVDLQPIINRIYSPKTPPDVSRRFYLDQAVASADAWISPPEWAGCLNLARVVDPTEPVTLGFDGSRSRSDAVTDATALIGCCASDGHVFEIGVWEQPTGIAGQGWRVPVVAVEAAVRDAFGRYNVVGFYADPAKWETYVAGWEAAYGSRLLVKASRANPIEWWMTGGRGAMTVQALKQFHGAVIDQELTHDGSSALTRHALNARRRVSRVGVQISKEHPDSERKIDGIVAAVLAFQARLDAVAAGVLIPSAEETFVPIRIR
jgi:hypothetical protein